MEGTHADRIVTRQVFITGGTGYIGRALVARLLARGHHVRALARAGSAGSLPAGVEVVVGDALQAATFSAAVAPADTLVHLVGTPHPSPWKGPQFRAVDLRSIEASVAAAAFASIRHVIYVSVAHPAPVMRDYIAVRRQGEALIDASGIPATCLRPWYVLGPGHRWPSALLPVYALLERLPATTASAHRLGLVTHTQMVTALLQAVEHPPANGVRIVDVPAIRAAAVV